MKCISRLISNVHRGTAYEEEVQKCFDSYGMRLRRVGGANDGGTDLLGYWHLDDTLKVSLVVQCKAVAQPRGPNVVRELVGTMQQQSRDTLGIIVSSAGFTQIAIKTAAMTMLPVGLAVVTEPVGSESGLCTLFWMNAAAQKTFPGLVVGMKMVQHKSVSIHYRCRLLNKT